MSSRIIASIYRLFSPLGHTHTKSQITDFGSYAASTHTHTKSQITDFGSYAAASHTHTPASIGAAAASHTHSGYAPYTVTSLPNISGCSGNIPITLQNVSLTDYGSIKMLVLTIPYTGFGDGLRGVYFGTPASVGMNGFIGACGMQQDGGDGDASTIEGLTRDGDILVNINSAGYASFRVIVFGW